MVVVVAVAAGVALLVLTAAVLWLLKPSTAPLDECQRHTLAALKKTQAFAHRGLFDENVPENSLAAFVRAAERGFGSELDVQLTADGQLVIAHDDMIGTRTFKPAPNHKADRLLCTFTTKKMQQKIRACGR